MKNVLFAVTLIASAVAFADNSNKQFNQLDTNQNGRISHDEAQANPLVAQDFSMLDVNGDDQLSNDEFKQVAAL